MTTTPNHIQSTVAPHTGRANSVVTGKKEDMKEVGIVAAGVILLMIGIGAAWFLSRDGDTVTKMNPPKEVGASQAWSSAKDAGQVGTTVQGPIPMPVSTPSAPMTPEQSPAITKTELSASDLYFDFDRSELRDEAKRILQERAQILTKESGVTLLVQGFTDQHGPAKYNKTLGLKRAEAVKTYLVELSVPEASVQVVSHGKEGTVCTELNKACSKRNRRVHLELIKTGAPSASLNPVAPTAPAQPEATPAPVLATTDTENPGGSKAAEAQPGEREQSKGNVPITTSTPSP
ncbi:MAG: OmpA family protein [Nitrospiraceae bacterium]